VRVRTRVYRALLRRSVTVTGETWVPTACTLPTAEQPLRVAEFDALFATAVRPAERTGPTTLLVHLPADAASTIRDLVARETACCSFFSFDVRASESGTDVLVRVPEQHSAVLDALSERAESARANTAP
jgi:hypothetical protein